MKTNRKFWSLAVAAGLALPLATVYGQQTPTQTDLPQQQTEQQTAQQQTAQQQTQQQPTQRQQQAVHTGKDVVQRASEVIGMTVKNNSNQDLGEVNDVVVDTKTGDIKYLALSYGGVLGLGDKLFAIPVDAFTLRANEDGDDYHLVLGIDEETLKSGPGFDQDQWPNFADQQWRTKLEQHYRKSRTDARATDRADIDATRDRVATPTTENAQRQTAQTEQPARTNQSAAMDTIHRVSKIQDMTVRGRDNKELGDVEDVVLNLREGKVEYLALSYGGILGIGDKLFAVPFEVFTLQRSDQDDEHFLAVNLTESQLKSAPGFEEDSWPNLADRRWRDEVDRHYSAQRQDDTTTERERR